MKCVLKICFMFFLQRDTLFSMFMSYSVLARAIISALMAFSLLSIFDAMRKWLALSYDIFDILFWQGAIGLIFLLLVAHLTGGLRRLLNPRRARWHILRGVLLAFNTMFALFAISNMPIIDAYAIFFLNPFVVSILSVLLLKERIGPMRLFAIIVGLCGVFIALRPGFAEVNGAYLFAFASVFVFSFSNLITRYIGPGGDMPACGIYPLICLCFLCLFVKGGDIVFVPDLQFFVISVVGAVMYSCGLLLVAYGYQKADVAFISPFSYTQLPWGIVLGYMVFDDIPDIYNIIGSLIIVGSGVFFFIREHRKKKRLSVAS